MKCWLCGGTEGSMITGIMPYSYVHPKCGAGEYYEEHPLLRKVQEGKE